MIPLNEAKNMGKVIVVNVLGDENFQRKYAQVGLYQGQEIEVLSQAPFRGPLRVQVGNTEFAMRTEDAVFIQVARK